MGGRVRELLACIATPAAAVAFIAVLIRAELLIRPLNRRTSSDASEA